jgi:hypothetical protein
MADVMLNRCNSPAGISGDLRMISAPFGVQGCPENCGSATASVPVDFGNRDPRHGIGAMQSQTHLNDRRNCWRNMLGLFHADAISSDCSERIDPLKRLTIPALFLAATFPATGGAVQLGGNPGSEFDMPAPGDGYLWNESMSGITDGDTLLDFNVQVPVGGALLRNFQVFGGCDAFSRYEARFSLFLDGTATPWSWNWEDVGGGPCYYHTLESEALSEGLLNFKVVFDSADAPPPPGFDYADVRFGDVMSAIPVPAPILLLMTGLGALGLTARRRRDNPA